MKKRNPQISDIISQISGFIPVVGAIALYSIIASYMDKTPAKNSYGQR